MKIYELRERPALLLQKLLNLWEQSVRTTHLFLSEAEILRIREYVPQALAGVPHLILAENAAGEPAGFMGIDGNRLEMLFLAPESRGHGLGRAMLEFGIQTFAIREVTVNEQNPQALGFYQHLGFAVYKRTALDEQGNPYPLLYMRRS